MKRQTLYFILILLSAILLSGITTYFYLDGRNFRQSDYSVLTQAQAASAREILDNIPTQNYKQVLSLLQEEANSLSGYIDILEDEQKQLKDWHMLQLYPPESRQTIKSRFSYSLEQAHVRSQVLDYCMGRLRYVMDWENYLDYVRTQSEKMSDYAIFSPETKNNIKKTGRDFSVLEAISPAPNSTIGISMLLLNPFSNIIAISISVICAMLLSVWLLRSNDIIHISDCRQYIMLFILGIIAIFLAEVVATDMTWELGDLSISLHSMEEFKTCRYELSMAGLLFLRIFFKCIGCLLIFLLSTALFCIRRGYYIWIGLVAALGVLQRFFLIGTSWDLQNLFKIENLIGIYQNSNFFDTPFAAELPFMLSLIPILLFCTGFASRQLNRVILLSKERREKEYFDEINNRYSEIRMLRHDINNHLSAMSLLLTEGKVQDAQRYLQAIKTDMEESALPARTGVTALDLVLWNKISTAKEKGILIKQDIGNTLSGLSITDYELCSLFGNLLDNAIEAVQKLPEAERTITLSVKRQMDMLCIFCENPYDIIKKENGTLTTLKTDKKNHGLGIRRIKHIAAKYHGTVDIKTENQTFIISVLLTASAPK